MAVIKVRGAIADWNFVERGLLLPERFNANPTEFDAAVQSLDEQEIRLLAEARNPVETPARKKRGRSKSS
jgi:hypothetical protein